MINLRLTYYPWITQNVDPHEIRMAVNAFATEISGQLKSLNGIEAYVEVLKPLSVPEQLVSISTGQSELALMNPLGFVFAHRRNPKVEAAAVALRTIDGKVGPKYYAQIYTIRKTAIRSLEGLRGRTIGFGLPYSTSSFLIPAWVMFLAKIHPFASFRRVEFLGGHELVAKAVYDGAIDAGAGHDGVIRDLAGQYGYGDAESVLFQIVRSSPIHSDPVAVNIADDNLKATIRSALVAASSTQVGKRALARCWGNVHSLSPTVSGDYYELEESLEALGLREEDLLH